MIAKIENQKLGDPKHTLYLVDVSSFIFRAFFAIRTLTNSKGVPTNATYGVATMLKRLLDEANPQYLGVIYDSKEPSFRKELYDDYKANRSAPPEDLVPQFEQINKLVSLLKFHSFRAPGFEADDLIATLTKRWCEANQKNRVVIVTGDKDLMQLVGNRVVVWDTMKQKVFGSEEVKEKFGISPKQIRDYLSLVGDSSDNIPGVRSIGPKSAVTLLKQFGDLDSVLTAAQTGKIAGKKGEVIQLHQKEAKLSQELVSLKEDIKVNFREEDFKYQFGLDEQLTSFLKEMGFKTLIEKWSKELGQELNEEVGQKKSDQFVSVQDEKTFTDLLDLIEKKKSFCFDLETTSLNPREAKIVGVAIACDSKKGYYIPIGHQNGKQLSSKKVLQKLKKYIEGDGYQKIAQNLKYDMSVLIEHGITPKGQLDDTMIASYVINSAGRHNFNWLCERYLEYTPISFESVCGKGKDQITFDQVEISKATTYAAEDALYTFRLWELFSEKLRKEKFTQYYEDIERPLIPILTKIELQGVCIDQAYLKGLSKEFEKEIIQIEKKIFKFSKEPFNINSPKQLAKFLFEDLKLAPKAKKKTGYSTDSKVLQSLVSEHEVASLVMEYRELSKLKGTYVDPLPKMIDPKTDRIHGSFHQAGTTTGRLSSSHPNLQNIPIRSERGQRIRRSFVPCLGNELLSADYSQIELRILAHMSDDPGLVQAFRNDEDIHQRTAGEIFGIDLEQVTSKQRSVAKAINFGLMYGKTPFGLSQELKISRSEAKDFIDRYFSRYKKVKLYLESLIEDARKNGFAKTMLGRVRFLPEIDSKNPMIRQNAERMAMNAPMQGTAAELMKLAMIHLDQKFTEQKIQSKMIIQVHDEILVDCKKDELNKVQETVKDAMVNALELKVPLRVNISAGQNWMELK